MKKLISIIVIAAIIVGCSQNKNMDEIVKVSSGKIERIENFPSKFVSPRNVDIWLPEGYNKYEKYAVIYMHDGQLLYDATTTWNNQEWEVDEVLSRLIDSDTIKKCIVVGIWNSGEGRHSDYFPQKPFESLEQSFQDSLLLDAKRYDVSTLFSNGIQSDNYLKFIVEELKPIIDRKYSTLSGKENTIIAGSSMGGLISMYGICEYPEIFGGAACLSTHWVGTFTVENNPIPQAFVDYLATSLPDPGSHKIYFDYGTKTLDALYEPMQMNVDSVMLASGYNETNWKTLKFEGADHSEKSWAHRLDIPFTFLMGK